MHTGSFFRFSASLLALLLLVACGNSRTTDSTRATKKDVPTVQPQKESPVNTKVNIADFETLLDGVWNSSRSPVTQGRLDEFTWGSAWVDDKCIVFSFIKADKPFLYQGKRFRYIKETDFANKENYELKFSVVDNYDKDQGILSVVFVNNTEIRFSSTKDVFGSGLIYNASYYKVAGPGVNNTK